VANGAGAGLCGAVRTVLAGREGALAGREGALAGREGALAGRERGGKVQKKGWAPGKFPAEICPAGCPIDYGSLETVGEETRYSSLMPWHLQSHNAALRSAFASLIGDKKRGRILDATAHVGVDAINLAQVFATKDVLAVELERATFAALKRNVATVAGVRGRSNTVTAQLGNGVDVLVGGEAAPGASPYDLVYLDPPWGGPDYKKAGEVDLVLTDGRGDRWTMPKLIEVALGTTARHICLKAPLNYADRDLIVWNTGWRARLYQVRIENKGFDPSLGRSAYVLIAISPLQ
jgi:16S rRNA G966 N2-methylase RsmD